MTSFKVLTGTRGTSEIVVGVVVRHPEGWLYKPVNGTASRKFWRTAKEAIDMRQKRNRLTQYRLEAIP